MAEDAVNRHLAACPACARECEVLAAAWSMLGAWGAPAPQPTFTAGVLARVLSTSACEPVHEALVEANGVVDASIRPHVEICAACVDEAVALRATWSVLDKWPDLEPSPALAETVSARVATGPRRVSRAPFPRFFKAWGTIAAVLAVLLGTAAVVQTTQSQGGAGVAIMTTTTPSGAQVAAMQGSLDVITEGDDILDDIKEPAPLHKTDAIIDELLTASFRTAVR